MDARYGELRQFQAEIDGFSGPFDLLCWLVENRELEASGISVGQVVRIYGAYLANTNKVSISVVSDFLSMAASLVLNKIRALLPRRDSEADEELCEEESGDAVLERLAKYRPYRSAAHDLSALKERQDRFFFRVTSENQETEALLDLGDLFTLCRLWWDIWASRKKAPYTSDLLCDAEEWNGVPTSPPEEELIDRKISEILSELSASGALSLSALLRGNRAVSNFIVTFLALLEMSRLGRIRITQEVLFDDVVVLSL